MAAASTPVTRYIYSLGGNSTILQNQATNNGGGVYLFDGSLFKAASGTNVGYDVQAGNGNSAILGAGLYVETSTVGLCGPHHQQRCVEFGRRPVCHSECHHADQCHGRRHGRESAQLDRGATGLNGGGAVSVQQHTRHAEQHRHRQQHVARTRHRATAAALYVRQGSVLTATNSRIERHALPSAFDGRGAGLYIYDATVTLSNTQVQTNTDAPTWARRAHVRHEHAQCVGRISVRRSNRASGGVGGAIAATNAADINVNNATFQNNSAGTHGGAIYLDGGTLDATGWWDFRFNAASGNGGAVAVVGTADADFVRAATAPVTWR